MNTRIIHTKLRRKKAKRPPPPASELVVEAPVGKVPTHRKQTTGLFRRIIE